MVVNHKIIVDGFGDMDGAQRIAMRLGLLRDDADRVGTVVAADIEEAADLVRPQDVENFLAIFDVRLVARRAERGGGRAGHEFEIVGRLLRQIGEILVDDSAHAVKRAVDALDLTKFARFQHGADQRLVDDGGRTAALRDENLGKINVGQGNLREAVGGAGCFSPLAGRRGATGLDQCAVAMLVFFAGAAGTGLVAADLAPGGGI